MLPRFETDRMELRPSTMADLDTLWAIWAEPEVRRYLFDDVPVSRDQAADVLQQCLQSEEGLGLWTVFLNGSEACIGCVGLLATSTAAEYDSSLIGAVEPLVAFAPGAWHHGYATEALITIVRYAFDHLSLPQLTAVIDEPNQASDRLIRRLGFQVRGECDGPRYRLQTYVLTKEQFLTTGRDSSERR